LQRQAEVEPAIKTRASVKVKAEKKEIIARDASAIKTQACAKVMDEAKEIVAEHTSAMKTWTSVKVKAEVKEVVVEHASAMKTRSSVRVKVAQHASAPPPLKEEKLVALHVSAPQPLNVVVKGIQKAYKELKSTKQQSLMILGRNFIYPVQARNYSYSQAYNQAEATNLESLKCDLLRLRMNNNANPCPHA